MNKMIYLMAVVFLGIYFADSCPGISQEIFSPQVPFNLLYAGGVEHTFIRVDHPQWDAVEFQTNASGRGTLLITFLDGRQIHYLDQEPLVQMRRKFDTSVKPRDYRYAPMKYQSKIEKEGTVEVSFSAKTDMGMIEASFFSAGSLKEMNEVTDPFNHAMEVVAILHMEKTAPGGGRTGILLDGKPLKIRWDHVSFVQGANFGIIFRTDQKDERLLQFKPGEKGWVGARWVYDLGGSKVNYSIEREKDSEGYYEIKRLGNMIVQKAWTRPVKGGREVRRVSTYSLVHENKEFIVEFEPPLFFPSHVEGKKALSGHSDFRVKISNSGWSVNGRVGMESREEGKRILTEMEFLPRFPEFLTNRPVYYEIIESPDRYQVIAREGK